MSIRMTAMEFYCNRPTVVALIDFGLDVSMVNYGTGTELNTAMTTTSTETIMTSSSENLKSSEKEEITLIKGLLGHGKGRVIFDLKMDMDRVSIFLNKEDSLQLAMFVQERFLLDLKVRQSVIIFNLWCCIFLSCMISATSLDSKAGFHICRFIQAPFPSMALWEILGFVICPLDQIISGAGSVIPGKKELNHLLRFVHVIMIMLQV
jgi:hypothetical protein